MARAKKSKYEEKSLWDNYPNTFNIGEHNVSHTKSELQRTISEKFSGDDKRDLGLRGYQGQPYPIKSSEQDKGQQTTNNQEEIYGYDGNGVDTITRGDELLGLSIYDNQEYGEPSQSIQPNQSKANRANRQERVSQYTNNDQSRLGELESDDLRYDRAERGSDNSDESLYRETSGRGATRDNEINVSSTFEHSIRRLDAQTNNTLSLDDSFGELGDDRRHPSQRASGRGEARGANDSSIQAGVLGEGYSLRGRSEEVKRDGQYGSGNLQDNGGTIDLQGISQSERRKISDERDKRKTTRTLKKDTSSTDKYDGARSLFDFDDEEVKEEVKPSIIPQPQNINIEPITTKPLNIISTGENKDFTLENSFQTSSISKKEKFKNNIEAIKLANSLWTIREKALENNQNFTITRQEQEIISKFSGWGGISEAFNQLNEDWQDEYKELKELLSPDEYASARASTTTAFFTPKFIVDSMYKALDHMGINAEPDKEKKILEPSAGNGAFLASCPIKGKYKFDALEIENQTNKFLTLLYPTAQVYSNEYGFEDLYLSEKTQYDAIIGNPPYDRLNITKIADSRDLDLCGYTIHNFFAAKSLRHLKDDGILSFVITHNFLDAKNNSVRDKIAANNTFLGAVRLPNNAFSNEAKTEVVTDIVFFKKGLDNRLNREFVNTTSFKNVDDNDIHINEYFKNNPQNVLGRLEVTSGRFGYELNCLPDPNINLETAIDNFIKNELPSDIYKYHEPAPVDENELIISKFDKEYSENKEYFDSLLVGNYLIFGDEIYSKSNSLIKDEAVFRKLNFSAKEEKIAKDYIKLRDCRKELFALEKQDIDDNDQRLIDKRNDLNAIYDNFVKSNGYLNNRSIINVLKDDADFSNIKGLEKDGGKNSFKKADVFKQRVLRPRPKIEFDNAADGLYASMNVNGKISIPYIANHINKDPYDVSKELLDKKLIFIDPDAYEQGNTEYIFAPKYLSGNVKEKYKKAEDLAKTEPLFYNNVESLKDVLPKDIPASEINPTIGVSWIPMKYYEEFFKEKFELHQNTKLDIFCSSINAEWVFEGSVNPNTNFKVEKKYAYYHPDNSRLNKDPYEIAQAALNGVYLKIYVTTDRPKLNLDGSIKMNKNGYPEYEKELDMVATQEVTRKIDLIRNEFDEWIMKDYARRTEIASIFNERFNCYAKKHYDGDYLQISGINQAYHLRKHQKDAVARAVNEKVTLIDHEVGAGKTLTAICSIMEQKKLGIVNKPLVVVPNHLVSQWSNEFLTAYPEARLLVAEDKSMSKDKRAEFLAQIANGNYDAIIMKQTQFKEIPAPAESQKEVLDHMIAELEQAIAIREENSSGYRKSPSVKRMETQLKSLKDNVTKILEDQNKNVTTLDFSDLGVDYLIVDESHMYKNLRYSTKLENVKGLGTQSGSDRAMDMYSKTTYLHNQDNAKIMFLTGTPVSNSLVELYLIERYLAPNALKDQGIDSFDAWAKTYADIDRVYETGAVAGDYKIVTRFTGFKNLNTLGGSYLDFADVITNDDIKKELGSNFVPNVNIKHTKSPASDLQKEYIGVEQENGQFNEGSIIYRLENMPDDPRIDNHLKVTNDAKYCALDYRLIDPFAEDDPNSKINKAVENIINTYEKWNDDKGTQLVFLDMGTPKSPSQQSQNIVIDEQETTQDISPTKKEEEFININDAIEQGKDTNSDFISETDRDSNDNRFFLYGDLLRKLVKNGIPQNEIAFIHDATTDKQKYELFDKVNRGEIRVLIGSTGKMGAGTNVQERVTAIHHLDIPWKPSDLTQRNGRVIRQGNELLKKYGDKFEVDVNYYVTLNTYDETSLQTVKQKAESITKFRKCVVDENHISGFEEEVVNYEELKAIASGNPLILTNFKINNELERLEREKKAYIQDFQQKEAEMHNLEKMIEFFNKRINLFTKTKEYVGKFESSDGLRCAMFSTNLYNHEVSKQEFFIPKASAAKDTQEIQNKMKEQFQANINLMFQTPKKSYDVCEYKGFVVSGYYSSLNNSITFELTNKESGEILAPENMYYNSAMNGTRQDLKEQVGLHGFFIRMNNYFDNMEKFISKEQKDLDEAKSNLVDLKSFLSEQQNYPKNDLIELLKSEKNIVLNELERKKKDKTYESKFESRALKIIDEAKRAKKQNIQQQGGLEAGSQANIAANSSKELS